MTVGVCSDGERCSRSVDRGPSKGSRLDVIGVGLTTSKWGVRTGRRRRNTLGLSVGFEEEGGVRGVV